MTKITAEDYFKDSILFSASIVGKPTLSATSSSIRYVLTCKKCDGVTERRGNSTVLTKCSKCSRVWNRDDNTIDGEPSVGGAVTRTTIVDSDEESSEEEPTPTVVRSSKHYANLIRSSQPKPVEPVKPAEEKKHYVIDILDHYDQRVQGYWYRFYYCAWYGSDEYTFVKQSDFDDETMINAYEEKLPVEQRYKTVFKTPTAVYKGKKVRTKEDVLKDAETETASTTTTTTTDRADEETVTIRISRVIILKKGAPIEVPDGYTYEYI